MTQKEWSPENISLKIHDKTFPTTTIVPSIKNEGACHYLKKQTTFMISLFQMQSGKPCERLIHSKEHGVCGVVQFLEVAAGTGESVFIVFCVCGTPGTALCSSWRSPLGQDARHPWSFAWVVRHGRLSVGIRVRSCVALHGPYWAIFS